MTATSSSLRQVSAHKMVLAAASPLFARFFHLEDPANSVSPQDFIAPELIDQGGVPVFSSIREDSFQLEHPSFPVHHCTDKWDRLVLRGRISVLFPVSKQGTVLTLSSRITDDLWKYVM